MSTSKRGPKNRPNASSRSKGNTRRPNSGKNSGHKKSSYSGKQAKRNDNPGRLSGGAPRKYAKKDSSRDEDKLDPIPGNREWGGLARKGVLRVYHDDQKELEMNLEEQESPETIELEPEELERQEERQRKKAERDRRQEELQIEARAAIARAQKSPSRKKKQTPRPYKRKPITRGSSQLGEMQPRFRKSFGQERGKKNLKHFFESMKAYEEERFIDASRKIRPLVKVEHKIPEIYELFGLILYRTGEYQKAAEELENFRSFASSTDQHPVLMDCYRAGKRWNDVDYLWAELREVSPSGPVVIEGRIVMAGALADRGNLKEAVRVLEKGWKPPKRPQEHHLRRAYALADLYDRSGHLPRAREIFGWIVKFAPDFVDSKYRLKNLN